eukprot:12429395-Karenia_brevis.AAC.1
MENFGFQMYDITEAALHATSLGRVIDGQAGVMTNSSWRAERLTRACTFLGQRPSITSKQLGHMLGHIMDLFGIRPELLSVLRSGYDF